jgi:hypothetical protein
VSGLHTQLGAVTIAVNALAALIGLVAWLARRNPRAFWIVLRVGQALVIVEAVVGAKLPQAEQHELVQDILRRELAVMATSAAVVALLAMRAQGWL